MSKFELKQIAFCERFELAMLKTGFFELALLKTGFFSIKIS
jgi:hypothetical protein